MQDESDTVNLDLLGDPVEQGEIETEADQRELRLIARCRDFVEAPPYDGTAHEKLHWIGNKSMARMHSRDCKERHKIQWGKIGTVALKASIMGTMGAMRPLSLEEVPIYTWSDAAANSSP